MLRRRIKNGLGGIRLFGDWMDWGGLVELGLVELGLVELILSGYKPYRIDGGNDRE